MTYSPMIDLSNVLGEAKAANEPSPAEWAQLCRIEGEKWARHTCY